MHYEQDDDFIQPEAPEKADPFRGRRWRGGRGRLRFVFTYEDIAKVAGVKVGAVRTAAAKKVPAVGAPHAYAVDFADLESLVDYVVRTRERSSKRAIKLLRRVKAEFKAKVEAERAKEG